MGDNTGIEWTDASWNPVVGCQIVSPGCTNCYAMKMAARIEAASGATGKQTHYRGLTQPSKAGPVWTGVMREAPEAILTQPLRWRRPRRIFVNSMSDLFGEGVADETIDKVFAVMALSPQHTFQVLTKRSARMRAYMRNPEREALWFNAIAGLFEADASLMAKPHPVLSRVAPLLLLPNAWLGVSAEDQTRADERIPDLLATRAAVRFVSGEPLLGPIDLAWALSRNPIEIASGFQRRGHFSPGLETLRGLDWIIVGGESGPSARPMHPDWVRQVRDDCAKAVVAFFFKQWGEWAPAAANTGAGDGLMTRVGKKAAGRVLDGRTHDAMPAAPR